MRLLECREVANSGWIEHGNVRFQPFAQHTAIVQPDALRRECRHLVHGVFERDHVQIAHVAAQHAHERAIAARVRTGLTENRDLAVRSDHRIRVLQDALEIVLVDRVENPLAASLLDDPERGLGGVLDCRFEAATLRHFAEPLPGQGWIPVAARELDILRIASPAFVVDEANGLAADFRARRRRPQALQQTVASSFERPGREQRGLNARRGRRVGILIDGGIDAAGARFVHEPQRLHALSPVLRADDLVMGHLSRQAAFLADFDRLAHAVQDVRRFIAHVGDVDSAHLPRHLRELDHLGGRRERAGDVEETRAQPERTIFHALPHERAHLLELVGRGLPIDRTHHPIADRSLADEAGEVRRDVRRRHAIEKRAERDRRRSIRPFDERRDALADIVVGGRHVEDAAARVGVNVDEPGRNRLAGGVDDPRRRRIDPPADPGNRVAANGDVASIPGAAGAVDDPAVLDDQIVRRRLGTGSGRRQRKKDD